MMLPHVWTKSMKNDFPLPFRCDVVFFSRHILYEIPECQHSFIILCCMWWFLLIPKRERERKNWKDLGEKSTWNSTCSVWKQPNNISIRFNTVYLLSSHLVIFNNLSSKVCVLYSVVCSVQVLCQFRSKGNCSVSRQKEKEKRKARRNIEWISFACFLFV